VWRGILFVVGFAAAVLGAGLLVAAYVERNPYSERDAQPFSIPINLDGSEKRIAFTATTSENYELNITVNLPAEAKEGWVRYSCLMGTTPMYHSCDETGHLRIFWTVRDLSDGTWRDWTVNSQPEFENGEGKIGWFRPVRDHAYAIAVRAESDVPAIRQSPANLYAYFGDAEAQGRVAMGNFVSILILVLGIPLTLLGVLLVAACWPRKVSVEIATKV
jgi:hypothetical protein